MFYIKEPSLLDKPWVLSNYKDEKCVSIPKDVTKDLKSYDILGIDFLYQNFRKKFKGAILNEEDEMNMIKQSCVFLNAMYKVAENNFLVLILCPDNSLPYWHYHLLNHSGLSADIITPDTCPEDFDERTGLALLLRFSLIRLADSLAEYDYFSVIIDEHDTVANKIILRKLSGTFNIGLTKRNFYINRDQKLLWTMLNWSNPGCVGKLAEFYDIDKDNFENFRDNYRHWWFRLTWQFCESFKKPTEQEIQEYDSKLSSWKKEHRSLFSEKILIKPQKKPEKTINNNPVKKEKVETAEIKVKSFGVIYKNSSKNKWLEKQSSTSELDTLDTCQPRVKKVKPNEFFSYSFKSNTEDLLPQETKNESDDSSDTIIMDEEEIKEQNVPKSATYVKLPSMDENPILDSIKKNFQKSPGPAVKKPFKFTSLDEPSCSKAYEENEILLSIINKQPKFDDSNQPGPSHRRNSDNFIAPANYSDNSDDFIKSLVATNVEVKKGDEVDEFVDDDVEALLRETDELLKKC